MSDILNCIDDFGLFQGCGISVPGPFRVATETTIVAMPEVAIGK
jgi:enoyl-CoA hydratase/carnithine racemase